MSYSSSQHIRTGYHMQFPGYFLPIESVHGLVCFTNTLTPIVWNPSTRQLLTLPEPKFSSRSGAFIVFLGYDPVEGKHKVMCLPYKKTCYVCRVFTLGSGQESWRTVKTYHKHRASSRTTGRCIKGVIYYHAENKETDDYVIMSFDVRSEKFHMIELPSDLDWGVDVLINYKGRLACAGEISINEAKLWILEDAEKHKWSRRDFVEPFKGFLSSFGHRDPSLGTPFRLIGCTHAGEFIYVPDEFHKASFLLFYDPVRNSCRRLQFEGIADDRFELTRYELNVFPNHIETLMSL